MTALLEVRDVSKEFRSGSMWQRETTVAVDDVTFAIPDDRSTITGIVGESGSGKTTLALMLLNHAPPTTGQVIYRGTDLAAMSRQEQVEFKREVQPIFQDPFAAFNPFYRVDHVLDIPIQRYRLASSKKEARQIIDESLELVGLRPGETLGRFPHQLSGGQRQRLMVARALLCRPRVIIADEPVSMVDASLRATILASLQMLNREHGISIVYITHDLTTAYQVCDNILVMYSGSVVEAGAIEKVIRTPRHPYTQLLISSIPMVDRTKRWEDGQFGESTANRDRQTTGCKFAPRCPSAQEDCWTSKQPLYRTEPDRAVSCIQYNDNALLEAQDIGQVLQ